MQLESIWNSKLVFFIRKNIFLSHSFPRTHYFHSNYLREHGKRNEIKNIYFFASADRKEEKNASLKLSLILSLALLSQPLISSLLRNPFTILVSITVFITCSLPAYPAAIFRAALTSSTAPSSLITHWGSPCLALFIYPATKYSPRQQLTSPSTSSNFPSPLLC